MRTITSFFLSAFLCATVVGCASSQHSTDTATYQKTSDGAIVTVLLDEYQIHMPTTIPSGRIDFHITNMGRHDHDFKISGNGVESMLPEDLTEGKTTDLIVNLTPGTYRVICPMLTHADLGMRLELKVQ